MIFKAVSANSDGKNDVFYLQNINAIPDTRKNKVTIFDRWGDVVFEVDDYDNVDHVFRGLNKGGSELPTGTYYYKIVFSSGIESKTGFISLKR